jgi:hypothetical protein
MLTRIKQFRSTSARRQLHRRVMTALALNQRGEARPDGLALNRFEHWLDIEWRARDVHPWDRDLSAARIVRLFAEQCLDDTSAALDRLFSKLPEIDVVEFKVTHPASGAPILSGSISRSEACTVKASSSGMKLKQLGVTYHLYNWQFEPLI